ncbi:MAG TPA: SHOCT domain-containing protein [Candidatus Eubacterium faecavium]|nr:SHOCT domain-containing protein [Candidatus Eubacterium faecavium]
MLPMAKRLYNALDKATFDYSAEDFENDLKIMDKIAKNEIIIDTEPSKREEIKEKVSDKLKNVGNGVTGLIGKFGKKDTKQVTEDPIGQVKRLKELLDIGAITQDEFDTKKKEILGL